MGVGPGQIPYTLYPSINYYQSIYHWRMMTLYLYNKIRTLCNLTWSARVVTYWWKFTEDILLWKIKLRFLYYTPVEAFRMVSLILLLLPLAFAADLPNIVIVLTDDQVMLEIVSWYKNGFWYWYCEMCLAKSARHFALFYLNSTFLFCILYFSFCIFHFVF